MNNTLRQQRLKMLNTAYRLCLMGMLAGLSGCGTLGGSDELPGSTSSVPVLKVNTANRCGNEPEYTLQGKTYRVLTRATGYQQEGMASVYGPELHGSQTAGCETFDSSGFSAAHRTLPLPSMVRVTHLQNGKSVVVRVNDRGPFDNNDLIRLSFAAANTLGMTAGGRGGKVRVEALSAHKMNDGGRATLRPVTNSATRRPAQKPPAQPKRVAVKREVAAVKQAKQGGKSFFVVVKNYQDQREALEMFVRLTSVGLKKTEMASAVNRGRKMHQVRIGPLYTQDQIDKVRDALASNGLATFKVVEVNQ